MLDIHKSTRCQIGRRALCFSCSGSKPQCPQGFPQEISFAWIIKSELEGAGRRQVIFMVTVRTWGVLKVRIALPMQVSKIIASIPPRQIFQVFSISGRTEAEKGWYCYLNRRPKPGRISGRSRRWVFRSSRIRSSISTFETVIV